MSKTTDIRRFSHDGNLINIRHYNVHSTPIHWHSFYELEVVISGEGTQTINGTKYSYKSRDAFLLGPSDFHEISIADKAEIWLLQVTPWFMPQDFYINLPLASLPVTTHLTEDDFNLITGLFSVVKTKLEKKEENSELTTSAIRTLLLYFLDIEKKKTGKPSNERLGMIYHYLQENFRDDITLNDIAKHFALNKNYLCTYFKKETGRTIVDCLREIRLMYASRLAVVSKKSTQEMCEDSGYNSVSHFLRDFKNRFGMSPMEMRKSIK